MKRLSAALLAAALGTGVSPAQSHRSLGGSLPAPGVVWVSDPARAARVVDTPITQRGRAFVPDLAVVTAGSSVRFRNDDDVDHSVYSLSPAGPFDIGIYEPGPGKEVAFPSSGVVEIHCHIHRHMRATLIVVDGPYARVDVAGGRWKIGGLARGRYVMHTWTVSSGETSRSVDVR